MRRLYVGWAMLGLAILSWPVLLAQQPAFPPVAAATARLDQTLVGLDGPGFGIAYAAGSDILAASCENGTIRFWHKDVWVGIRHGAQTPYVLEGHEGVVLALAASGSILASAGIDGKIVLWDSATCQQKHQWKPDALVRTVALSPDGATLATGGEGKTVLLWETATAKLQATLEGHTDWVNCLAFSSDGKQFASGGQDGQVLVWDLAAKKKLLAIPATPPPPANTPPPPTNHVLALAFSPDGKQLALGGSDAQVYLVNPADGKFLKTMPAHASSVTGLAFHPDGKLLASVSKDRTVKLWNATNGQLAKALEGHGAWVQGVLFLDQGTRLATVSADRTVKVWNLAPVK